MPTPNSNSTLTPEQVAAIGSCIRSYGVVHVGTNFRNIAQRNAAISKAIRKLERERASNADTFDAGFLYAMGIAGDHRPKS